MWQERDQRDRVEKLEKELAPLRDAERHLSDSLVMAVSAAAEVRAQPAKDAEELQGRAQSKAQEKEMDARRTWLENEIDRLEMVERVMGPNPSGRF